MAGIERVYTACKAMLHVPLCVFAESSQQPCMSMTPAHRWRHHARELENIFVSGGSKIWTQAAWPQMLLPAA